MPLANTRLVVIKPGALGDTLLLAPALRALRESQPALEITVVGCMPAVVLLKFFDVADAVIAIDRLNLYAPTQSERQLLRGAQVVAFIPLDRAGCDKLTKTTGAAMVVSYPSRSGREGQHTAEYLHQCLQTVFPQMSDISKVAFNYKGRNGPSPAKPYDVLSPGAGNDAKRAPMTVFIAAAHEVALQGRQPILLGGEVEMVRGLVRQYPPQYRHCLNPQLTELVALLHGAGAVFANDSGPAHLAGMLGVPTTVFFGPTDPEVWRPWGPHVFIRKFRTFGEDRERRRI